ncbi:hypothetical protein JCM3774_000892 [Rhodotorula dairenensis]
MFRFQQIYGQELPQARSSPAVHHQMLAPGSPEPWRDRLRRRRASPPHTPENLSRSGAEQRDSDEVGRARPPGAPTKPDAYGVMGEDEVAYGPGRWVHEVAPPVFPAPPKFEARDVLIRAPAPCPWWRPKNSPQHNAAALQAGLDKKQVRVVQWDKIHPHELQHGFLKALFRKDACEYHVRQPMSEAAVEEACLRFAREHAGKYFPKIHDFPSCSRPLATEADAAELFCTNVALGVRDVLNELLMPGLVASATSSGIRVEIESQARIGEGHHACVQFEPSWRSTVPRRTLMDLLKIRSALDFVLSLVSWPLTVSKNAFRFHLVSVEMKASSCYSSRSPAPVSSAATRPRDNKVFVRRYTRRDPQQVERHLISDYFNSVAVAIEKESVHESHKGEVIMAAIPIEHVPVHPLLREQYEATRNHKVAERPSFRHPLESPFHGGPRLALLYLAFEALRAYGVLNPRVRHPIRVSLCAIYG